MPCSLHGVRPARIPPLERVLPARPPAEAPAGGVDGADASRHPPLGAGSARRHKIPLPNNNQPDFGRPATATPTPATAQQAAMVRAVAATLATTPTTAVAPQAARPAPAPTPTPATPHPRTPLRAATPALAITPVQAASSSQAATPTPATLPDAGALASKSSTAADNEVDQVPGMPVSYMAHGHQKKSRMPPEVHAAADAFLAGYTYDWKEMRARTCVERCARGNPGG